MDKLAFKNNQFKKYLYEKLINKISLKKLVKFRRLNKIYNQKILENTNAVSVLLDNLEGLAKSDLSEQIQKLNVSISANLEEISELRFASVNYFPKILSVNVNIVGTSECEDEQRIFHIPESVKICGMKFVNKPKKTKISVLVIQAQDHNKNINLNIQNSTFDGISVRAEHFTNVEISKSFLKNEPSNNFGFSCNSCNSLIAEKILVKNQGAGVAINNVQKVIINNMEISSCVGSLGFSLFSVPRFEINNALIQNCEDGIFFEWSGGDIKNVVIRECERSIMLDSSRVKYSNIQYGNNEQGNIDMDEKSVFAKLN